MRTEYRASGLDVGDLASDPMDQLSAWVADAANAGLAEPNAMVLATIDDAGQPWTRHVLVKRLDRAGPVFFTSKRSAKVSQLLAHSAVGATFGFVALERQVNLTGRAVVVDDEMADIYFASRPRSAQLGAWASNQSEPAADRAEIEARLAAAADRFGDDPIPRPEHWGGIRIEVATAEFWQGRPSRLHDRLRFERTDDQWAVVRLNP